MAKIQKIDRYEVGNNTDYRDNPVIFDASQENAKIYAMCGAFDDSDVADDLYADSEE